MNCLIIVLTIIILLIIQNISCNDGLLSKTEFQFHQNGYKIKDIRASLIRFDKKYCNKLEVQSFKYNRTTTAINATLNSKIELQDKIEIVVQGYKFLSNEYRHFPLRFQVNLKKCFEANVMGLINVLKCGNITDFYFHKNVTYHVCNFVIDETHLPPLIPNGMYKFELTYLYLDVELAVGNLFAEIYTPTNFS